MMECTFQVGQKVVCVRDSRVTLNDMGFPGFCKGEVLTISEIFLHNAWGHLTGEEAFLRFKERDRMNAAHHSGFGPIVVRTTDISIFKSMLNPSRVKEEA